MYGSPADFFDNGSILGTSISSVGLEWAMDGLVYGLHFGFITLNSIHLHGGSF